VWKRIQFDTEREFAVRSNINNFINLYGLEFISLKNEALKEPKPECASIYRKDFEQECLVPTDQYTVKAKNFIDTFNSLPFEEAGSDWKNRVFRNFRGETLTEKAQSLMNADFSRYQLSQEDLRKVVLTGRMPPEIAHGFCGLFVRQLVSGTSKIGLKPNKSLSQVANEGAAYVRDGLWFEKNRSQINKLKKTCFDHVRDDEIPSFSVDRKIRIHSLEGERPLFRGGKQMNVNVGANTTFGRDDRFSINTGLNAMAGGRFFNSFINDMTSLLKLGLDINASKGVQTSTAIQEQTFLVMQSAAFDLKLKDYEHCAVINWNKKIFTESFWEKFFLGSFSSRAREVYIPGGYFICTGREKEAPPIYVREHYYYFTQHFTDGDMLDHGDLYNHPWLLALRGSRDVETFLDFLSREDIVMVDLTTSPKAETMYPIKKMVKSYLNVTPSFPGVHTLVNFYGPDYPWNEMPEESFKRVQEESLEAGYGKSILGLPAYDDMTEMIKKAVKNDSKYQDSKRGFVNDYKRGGNPEVTR
jgi:hypothetical protein